MNRETGTKILLIGSFAASLVLPTLVYPAVRSHLDQQNYENRELASFPELSAANFDNIPTEFEAYYNDHVPFKNLFVKVKTKLDLELLNESSISDVTVGKENWLFYTVSEDGEDALADYQRTNLYTADEKTALADAITSVNEKMKERGIRFVMFEAPNKESVYAEYMPDSVRVYGSESRLDAALPELAAQGLPVYDMKPELLKEADTYQLYYKYDTHWNQIGSFIGSQQIAQTLLGTSTPLSAVSIEAAGPASGDLARMLNMAAEYSDDTEYVIQNYLPEVTATTVDMNEDNSFAVFESDSPNDKTLLVVGDSFSQNLKYFMPKLYRKTVFATFDTYTEALLDEYQPDDFVYLEDSKAAPPFFSHLPKDLHPAPIPVTKAMLAKNAPYLSPMDAAPWGLSPHSLHLFEQLRDKAKVRLSVPTWKEDYFRLTGRQTAAECLEKIQALLPDLPIPVAPRFCTKIREVERYMILCNAPFVLKTPYSSSGRGLLWVEKRKPDTKTKNWIEGAFNKQGMISIESGLDKVQDFAMEFYSDGQGTVRYEGLSVFNTEERGSYTGNILEEQSTMLSRITRFTGEETYSRIQEAVRTVLQEVYGSTYAGCIGVDMLVYRQKDGSFAIHPCIEINMRYTMGMVALRLFQHYVAPRAVGDYRVSYEKEAGEALEKHRLMSETYPLRFANGRIQEGYLSLCPVTKDTHYRAYLLLM